MEEFKYICNQLSEQDVLCQVAEEASELAQATVKLWRVMNGTNPTPVTRSEAVAAMLEEIADVNVAVSAFVKKFDVKYDDIAKIEDEKILRWAKRLSEKGDN